MIVDLALVQCNIASSPIHLIPPSQNYPNLIFGYISDCKELTFDAASLFYSCLASVALASSSNDAHDEADDTVRDSKANDTPKATKHEACSSVSREAVRERSARLRGFEGPDNRVVHCCCW